MFWKRVVAYVVWNSLYTSTGQLTLKRNIEENLIPNSAYIYRLRKIFLWSTVSEIMYLIYESIPTFGDNNPKNITFFHLMFYVAVYV